MTDEPQPGPAGPFPGPFGAGFDLAGMMRMLQSEGPLNWEVASQVAGWVALADPETGAMATEPEIAPERVERITALARAAQTHVGDATGLPETHGLSLRVVGRRGWAEASLRGLRPVLEALATALSAPLDDAAADAESDTGREVPPEIASNPLLAFTSDEAMSGILRALGPLLLGVQAGSMAGLLAQRALGQYDLPLPLAAPPELLVVAPNVDDLATAWSLDPDEVSLAVTLRETVHGAQRTVPWVRDRLVRLAREYVSGYRLDEDAIGEQLGELDLTDPTSMQEALADPTALLGMMRSPAQDEPHAALARFASVLEGYADHVVERVGGSLVTSFGRVDEALRRHRLEQGRAAGFVERLLGLELTRDDYERGQAFCAGVAERAGPAGLNRLWEHESRVPTPAELEAPGLWLARIELDDDGSST